MSTKNTTNQIMNSLFLIALLVLSIIPAPVVFAGAQPLQILDAQISGEGLNKNFDIIITASDADDYVTKLALGETPYQTANYNTVNCPASVNTCTAKFTVGVGALQRITLPGTYYFRAFAKNANNQYAQYDVQVNVVANQAPTVFVLRTAVVDGNDWTAKTVTYVPATITAFTSPVQTTAFATFNVNANTAVGVSYVPTDSAYNTDTVAFYLDSRLSSCQSAGCSFSADVPTLGTAATACTLNQVSTKYDCTLNFAGGVVPFEFTPVDAAINNSAVVRYYKPLYKTATVVLNFNGASLSTNEGQAVQVNLNSYLSQVASATYTVKPTNWGTIVISGNTATITPFVGSVGNFIAEFTATANGISDSDSLTVQSADIVQTNAAPVITIASPTNTTLNAVENTTRIIFTVGATDPEGQALTYTWTDTSMPLATGTNTISWLAPAVVADSNRTIQVVVSDGTNSVAHTWTVAVSDNQPTVSLAANTTTPNEGDTVAFTATASVAQPDSIVSYDVDFEGDGIYDVIGSASNTASFTYVSNGTYNATVRVTDSDADQVLASTQIVVGNVPVTNATLTSANVVSNEPGSFDMLCSAVGGNAPYTFTTTVNGNTVANVNGAFTLNALANGTYAVDCTAQDVDGDTLAATTQSVVIADMAPVANFTASTYVVVQGIQVDFFDASTTPFDPIVSYAWDVDGDNVIDALTANTSTVYNTVGVYNVTLTIADSDGSQSTTSASITVNSNDTQNPSVINVISTPVNVIGGNNVVLSADVSDDTGVASVLFNVTLPDNTTAQVAGVNTVGITYTAPFTSSMLGTYTVQVIATDVVGKVNNTEITSFNAVLAGNVPVLTPIVDVQALEGTPLSLVFYASDVDQDPLVFAKDYTFANETFGPAQQTLANANTTWTFTPNASDVGNHTIIVNVTDGLTTVQQSFNMEVLPVGSNVNPVLTLNINGTVTQGVNNTLVFTATDLNGNQTLTFSKNFSFANETFNSSTGVWTFTPNATEVGNFTVNVTVTDGNGGSASQIITIIVLPGTPGNNAPVLNSIANQFAVVGNLSTITVVATDADNDTLTFSKDVLFLNETFDNTTGVWSFTPFANETGNVTVQYTVSDGNGGIATQSFQISVSLAPVGNNAPVFNAVSNINAVVGVPFNVTVNATDADNDVLTYSKNVSFIGETFDNTTGFWSYTPTALDIGTYDVQFTVDDGRNGTAVIAFQLFITLTPNNAPNITQTSPAQVFTISAGATQQFNVTVEDVDNQNMTINWLVNGVINQTDAAVVNGSTVSFSYGFYPAGVYNITAQVTDGIATTAYPWDVTAQNNNPIMDLVSTQFSAENSTLVIDLNATDVNGDVLTYAKNVTFTNETFDNLTGIWTINFDFNESGTYTINASVADGFGGMNNVIFDIQVNNTNRLPTIVSVVPASLSLNENVTGTVQINAVDADGDVLNFTTDATAFFLIASIDNAGLFSVTPQFDENFTDYNKTIQIFVDDNNGGQVIVPVDVSVFNVNRAPVFTDAIAGTQNLSENQTMTLDFDAIDADNSVVPSANQVLTFSKNFSFDVLSETFDNATGIWTFTPNFSEEGVYPVQISVSDGVNTTTKDIVVNVSRTNIAPVLAPLSNAIVNENSTMNFTASAFDFDGDVVNYTTDASMVLNSTNATIDPVTGVFSFTPTFDQVSADTNYTINITATDSVGATHTLPMNITVVNVNRLPVVLPVGPFTVDENATLSFSVNATDLDGNAINFTTDAGFIFPGASINNATGVFTYTPTFDAFIANQTGVVNIDVTDSLGGMSTIQVTIDVINVNRAPTFTDAIPANLNLSENQTMSLDFNAADLDNPAANQTLTFSKNFSFAVTSETFDTLTGVWTFTPNFSEEGIYPVTVSVTDGVNTTSRNLVINVSRTNVAPVLDVINPVSVLENSSIQIDANATDFDGDTIVYSTNAQAVFGANTTITIDNATGIITISPTFNQVVSDTPYVINVTVVDGNGGMNTLPVWVTVQQVNRAPVFTDSYAGVYTLNETQTRQFNFTATDLDAAQVLTYNTNFSFNVGDMNTATGVWTITPSLTQSGTYPVLVTVSDGFTTVNKTITIVVLNTNVAPVLNFIGSKTTGENQTLTFAVNGSDFDNDALNYAATGIPVGATFTPATQTFSWTPNTTQNGTYNVNFTVSDGFLTDSELVTITVLDNATVPTAAITATPTTGIEPLTVSMVGTPSGVAPLSLRWDCNNDGTWDAGLTSTSANCTYANNGTYVAVFNVMDADGDQVSAFQTITVLPEIKDAGITAVVMPTSTLWLHDDVSVNATVHNYGNKIQNVTVQLLVDGAVVNSTVVSNLVNGTSQAVSLTWPNAQTGSHTITVKSTLVGDSVAGNDFVDSFAQVESAADVIGANHFLIVDPFTGSVGQVYTAQLMLGNTYAYKSFTGLKASLRVTPGALTIDGYYPLAVGANPELISLPAGSSDGVALYNFTLPATGSYTVEVVLGNNEYVISTDFPISVVST